MHLVKVWSCPHHCWGSSSFNKLAETCKSLTGRQVFPLTGTRHQPSPASSVRVRSQHMSRNVVLFIDVGLEIVIFVSPPVKKFGNQADWGLTAFSIPVSCQYSSCLVQGRRQ